MSIRVILIAIATAASAVGAVTQPEKNQPPAKAAPATAAPVVLASASDARRPSATPAEPVRRPAPRVTTCRCGDPQKDQTADEQPDQ
jgi:hypothetical protein